MKSRKLSLIAIPILLIGMACMCTGTTKLGTPTEPPPAAPTTASQDNQGQPNASGIITKVVMAKDTQGANKDPVNPTTEFGSKATIHAVVQIQDAPANTKFKASWYVVDVGSAAAPNSSIDTTELEAEGSRNLDFSLAPTSSWPAGKYRVEIFVNGSLEQTVTYTVVP